MHDDDPQDEVELIEPTQVEATPIGLCTLIEIATHLFDRFDGIALAVINRDAPDRPEVFVWGKSELRQRMLESIRKADAATVDDDDVHPVD